MGVVIAIIALLVVGFILYKSGILNFAKKEKVAEDKTAKRTIAISDEINAFDIRIEIDNVEIKAGEEFKIVTSNPNLVTSESANVISVLSAGNPGLETSTIIYVPDTKKLAYIYAAVDTGNAYIASVMVKELKVQVKTGNLMLDKAMVSENGTYITEKGNIVMGEGSYYNSIINIETGNFTGTTKLCGETKMVVDIGNITIKSMRDLKSYTIKCKTENGRIGCDGIKGDKIVYGKGKELIDCLVKQGNITINYFE